MLARWWAVLIHQEPAETANPGREDAAELPRERRPYCLRPGGGGGHCWAQTQAQISKCRMLFKSRLQGRLSQSCSKSRNRILSGEVEFTNSVSSRFDGSCAPDVSWVGWVL